MSSQSCYHPRWWPWLVCAGASWHWLYWTWEKLLAGSHGSHPCSLSATKIYPHKPNTTAQKSVPYKTSAHKLLNLCFEGLQGCFHLHLIYISLPSYLMSRVLVSWQHTLKKLVIVRAMSLAVQSLHVCTCLQYEVDIQTANWTTSASQKWFFIPVDISATSCYLHLCMTGHNKSSDR